MKRVEYKHGVAYEGPTDTMSDTVFAVILVLLFIGTIAANLANTNVAAN